MFDYLEDDIVEANKDLKNSHLYYPGKNSLTKVDYSLLSLPTKTPDYFIITLPDYYLQVRDQDLTYRFV